MTKLIINSDDFGYSRAVNYGILDAHQEGILTSASLLANAPGFEHAVKLAKQAPTLGVGVHLNLTLLNPLRKDVRSLVDENENFYRPDAYRTGLAIADLDELYNEWDAQIQKVIQSGIQPTHLDAHHNANLFNEHHLDVFLDLADKYQLPVRGNFETDRSYKTTEYFEPSFDTVISLEKADKVYFLKNLIEKIKGSQSAEIMCHAGYVDHVLTQTSSLVEPRIYQTQLLTDSPFADKIREDNEIQLVTFASI